MRTAQELPWQHVHIVGMGGTGLSAVARVLLGLGVDVSGCDRQDGERLQSLAHVGAHVWVGHDPAHLDGADALLISSAVPRDHPEVAAAREMGLPVLKRKDFLPHLLRGREVIGVAGTHGKTTTTGMLVHTLRRAGHDIGYIVGSDLPTWGNADAGKDTTFVIEADEYDYMFWGLTPKVAVITNVEWDHVDCFPTRDAYMQAFEAYARSAEVVVACADDAGAMEVAQRSGRPVVTYGVREDAMWRAVVVGTAHEGGIRFQPVRAGTQVGPALTLHVPGYHNVLNALAALAALDAAGFPSESLAHHLMSYEGAGRRFQHVGEVGGVTIIDDYAHHPTEVKATLAAARLAYGPRRVWAVFQPHTYTRTRALLSAWRSAFVDADRVLVMDIYAARERDTLGLTGQSVAAAIDHPAVTYSGDVDATVAYLRQHARPGDVVITLGAGTSVQVARALARNGKEERERYRHALAYGDG